MCKRLYQRTSVNLKKHRNKESTRQSQAQYKAIINFNSQLKSQMLDNNVNVRGDISILTLHMYASDTTLQLKKGMRSAQVSDAGKLKPLVRQLSTVTVTPNSRTGHGFNHNKLGCMLIPVDYLEAYDNDPVRCVQTYLAFTH